MAAEQYCKRLIISAKIDVIDVHIVLLICALDNWRTNRRLVFMPLKLYKILTLFLRLYYFSNLPWVARSLCPSTSAFGLRDRSENFHRNQLFRWASLLLFWTWRDLL